MDVGSSNESHDSDIELSDSEYESLYSCYSGEDVEGLDEYPTPTTSVSSPDRYGVFERLYRCHPLSSIGKSHLEHGNQIIMPRSALALLLDLEVDEYPMLFKIENRPSERLSHCGVSEFTAEEGSVYLPKWMMENLQLDNGDFVDVKRITLVKGTRVCLQPHSSEFFRVSNVRAVLETSLRSYFCLTRGDTIVVNYNSKDYYFNVVDTKPNSAVCIIDADVEVDFVPSLDSERQFPEPPQPAKRETDLPLSDVVKPQSLYKTADHAAKTGAKVVVAETSKNKVFQPFTGKKYSLRD
ncbi:hypothetical protein K2173_023643 [Erythroxylum novogranatense]|uniref:Ubiquitin fusion degradaton protein n=1 Tax=Erythroxylum novogranatense TaxID=1862640 RepID=A0AAV8TRN7_9ROSI|nr:hypothetical protein K2173_023643 [Erythroxylum novogranatense]